MDSAWRDALSMLADGLRTGSGSDPSVQGFTNNDSSSNSDSTNSAADVDVTSTGDLDGELAELPNPDRVIFDDLNNVFEWHREDGENVLFIDPQEADIGDWQQSKENIQDAWANTGEASTESAAPIVSQFHDGAGKQHIDEICEFYNGKVPERFNSMIRECLFLSKAESNGRMSRGEVRKRIRQIAKHGDEAYELASLCTAGYLEENRIFQELYREQVVNGRMTKEQYGDVFIHLVKKRFFVVFVKQDDTVSDIEHEIIGKRNRLENFEPDIGFIDIRGIGDENKENIFEAIDRLEEDDEFEYRQEETDRELIIRINLKNS